MWKLIVFNLFGREKLMDMCRRAVVTSIDNFGRRISTQRLSEVTTTGGTKPLTKYEARFMRPLIKRLMEFDKGARAGIYIDVTKLDRESLAQGLDKLLSKH